MPHVTQIDVREARRTRPITGGPLMIACSAGRPGEGARGLSATSVRTTHVSASGSTPREPAGRRSFSGGSSASWEGSLPTGRGHLAYVMTQKIGALAFMPAMNLSTCRGAATA